MEIPDDYESFPISEILFTNSVSIISIILGYLILAQSNLYYEFIFLLIVLATIIWTLKARCSKCYYYGKRCPMGFGIIVSFLLKKGNELIFFRSPNYITSILLLPLLVGLIFLLTDFKSSILILLLIYIPIVFIQILLSKHLLQKSSCSHCKQKYYCTGFNAKMKY